MVRAIFLDRDGVVNDVIDRGEDCVVQGKRVRFTAPWKYEEFCARKGVEDFLNKLKELNFLVILVTNQPDITYGTMPLAEHERIMEDVKRLSFDDIFVCTHGREDNCQCKKPKPGMLLEAARKHKVDLKRSFMVGDTKSDVEAARSAGCMSVLLNDGRNHDVGADFRFDSFDDILKFIIQSK